MYSLYTLDGFSLPGHPLLYPDLPACRRLDSDRRVYLLARFPLRLRFSSRFTRGPLPALIKRVQLPDILMNLTSRVVLTAAAFAASVFSLHAADSAATAVARGKYIVEGVGMCSDCHTAHDEKGELVKTKLLQGTPLPFAATVPMPWANTSANIAGLPDGYTEKDMVKFLMTGERPGGKPPVLPPMPGYRMNQADAEAVTAYIKTLPKK